MISMHHFSYCSPHPHAKRGSGNVYNVLSQIQECGATNQIASFAINVLSTLYTKSSPKIYANGKECHMETTANSAMANPSIEKTNLNANLGVILAAAASFSYGSLKSEQEKALEALIGCKDVFVSLPTGYGKSLCYAPLPQIFDMLRTVDKASITIIISPLISLRGGTKSSIFHVAFAHTNPRHCGCVPIQLLC